MQTMFLNDAWQMRDGEAVYACQVPCSVYQVLLDHGQIPNPYVGENEYISTAICDRDFTFERRFDVPEEMLHSDRLMLTFAGIDTLAEVSLNGQILGETDNMHRTWRYEVQPLLQMKDNLLEVRLRSPNRYIAQKYAERPLWGVESTMEGYPYLRKAHCMFGWDWGPKLPDMGIWRDVSLSAVNSGRITSVYYTQAHGQSTVELTCHAELETWRPDCEAIWHVTDPDGQEWRLPLKNGTATLRIDEPRLWWVRGLGAQPLYTCEVILCCANEICDRHERRIGLRTLTVSQEKDEWGKEFCFINNGVKVFAMGGNYIPEDQLTPRCSDARTRKLLEDCKAANFNLIRVWGGGWYPSDAFYDWCDENGMMVWQDMMFACSAYLLTPEFEKTVRAELTDNITRLRNHAALALWCGNNEIESAWEGWGIPADDEARRDYLRLFEELIPGLLTRLDPETFYWPSSPSSGGGFQDSSSNKAGDMHYWAVWHGFKPIEAFREFYYRFCSEYGFESLPDIKTIRAFAGEGSLDLCGHVMETHQKCVQGNEKIMYYLAQMVNYPTDFERLIYCSQLVQADCIRSNVEHMRRARGRCMGSVYWQVNDSNPVISWSSIDYFGRWKGLHYAARRFYAPVLLSCDDTHPLKPVLHVSNDSPQPVRGTILCHLRNSAAEVLETWQAEISVPALSSAACLSIELPAWVAERGVKRSTYLEYALLVDDERVSAGTTLLVRPKAFDFTPTRVQCLVYDDESHFILNLRADAFAKSVCLSTREVDCVFSDNWFDIHGNESVTVTVEKTPALQNMSAEDFAAQLKLTHY